MATTNNIDLVASAYRQANLDSVPGDFYTNHEFPLNIAGELLNTVIQEMNRLGKYWFMETSVQLPYSPGVYSYSLSTSGTGGTEIDPKSIRYIRSEAVGYVLELKQFQWRKFQQLYRQSNIQTAQPTAWGKFGNSLELNYIPGQDYTLNLYYLRAIPTQTNQYAFLPCQEQYIDVFKEGVFAYLTQRLGRADWKDNYAFYINKVQSMLADLKEDSGMPTTMPRAF
jgi:hypothetical protein